LHRLEAAGLVASATEDIDGRRRRRFELTADGEAALKEEMRS
jgi:DNA-binding PadR family transcriptional regulator